MTDLGAMGDLDDNIDDLGNVGDDHVGDDSNEVGSDSAEDEASSSIEDAENIIPISGMYQDWFLDYASYVILERAVPALEDGLKPVQRRILHSLKELDDGRYNKVANVIGNTMKYHPHGDASIGDAMVQLGQKDLLIDCQGNWGNTLTGDRAAAPRYIEARLTKFALHAVFNPKTTDWLASYDGRNKEPVNLPIKFPLLLAQGGEGIAVGLACKMLPHNFVELIDNSINYLKGKKVEIFPDFPHGGMADFTAYNDGIRGGKVRVRARIRKADKKTLIITEIPYGTTTDALIESVVKANEKGKIKIKKIEDNTAAEAEIVVHLPPAISPDKMVDALYAFTDCEISISPNACVIENNTPVFIGASEMLKRSADRTVELLRWELEIKLSELSEQWHFASLEKIFIEKRIYRDIEECETWEAVLDVIWKGMHKYISTPSELNKSKTALTLLRDLTQDDIVRLTEIKIKRISKFDGFKADEIIAKLEEQITQIKENLEQLIPYAIEYFVDLKKRFGAGRERKTEIKVFDNISRNKVIVSNRKLYVNKEEGFIGWTLRKDDFVADCSEIDDVILFFGTGKMLVTKIADKKFVGKGIVHVGIWKKGDQRTIYHMVYQDGKGGPSYMKRFHVSSITRDKEYDLTAGNKGGKLHYFSCNPNGRRETVTVQLRPRPHLKKLKFEIDFAELIIKGRGSKGNRVSKELVSKVIQKETGGSTLAARKIWWDEVVHRLNDDGRGKLIGEFRGEDKIITIYKTGEYRITGFELSMKFGDDLIHIEKWYPERPVAAVYWDGAKELYYVKRFLAETSGKRVLFISEAEGSELAVVSIGVNPRINISYNKHLKATKNLKDKEEVVNELIDVKGVKAQGNQLTKLKVKEITLIPPAEDEVWPDVESPTESKKTDEEPANLQSDDNVEVVGTIASEQAVEIDLSVESSDASGNTIKPAGEGDSQMSLFDE